MLIYQRKISLFNSLRGRKAMNEKFTWGFLPSERVGIIAVRVRIVMALWHLKLKFPSSALSAAFVLS